MEVGEVIKEYILRSDKFDTTIKGRIIKYEHDDKFYWETSHYWKGTESAGGFYYPSKVSDDSIEEVIKLLFSYLKGFNGAAEITYNDKY